MPTLEEDLGAHAQALRETHISWVFLREQIVHKVKKPVHLPFVDFSKLSSRREACEAELRLNRRLAEEIYLGVKPVVLGTDGVHRIGGRGETVDYAVEMRRLRDADRADERLREGRLEWSQLQTLVERLREFHRAADTDADIAACGAPEAVEQVVRDNFRQTAGCIHNFLALKEQQALEAYQLGILRERRSLFLERMDSGRVRDGHGDLRLEHVYWVDGQRPVVIDCIEFSAQYRCGDVCSDVAFLAMDLTRLGRPDLAERFLAGYARETGDFDLYALADFYSSYRACVRGKIAAMVWADRDAPDELRERSARDAQRYFAVAAAYPRRALAPRSVIAVGGVIGSGKSTVADALAREISVPVVDSDRTRKQLLGASPLQDLGERGFGKEAYTDPVTEQVYAELERRAGLILASGRSVVVDASFRTRAVRERFSGLAARNGAQFTFVECEAPLEVCRQRLQRRETGASVSDARADLLETFISKWQPVVELGPEQHWVLNTSRPVEETVPRLLKEAPCIGSLRLSAVR